MSKQRLPILLAIIGFSLLWPLTATAWTPLYTCNPTWPDNTLPVPYHVNENGISDWDMDELRQVYANSFEVWNAPCCSGFRATDAGLTGSTGENQSDTLYVASVREDAWPRSLGDQNTTLGVTMPMVTNTCVIVSADTVYNNVGFDFVNGTPRGMREADLQSIATHEFGHFLGLGHTSVYEATMYAAYNGGTGSRDLHQDDIDGVCALYNRSCTCDGPQDCYGDEDCIDGMCQLPPCCSSADDDAGNCETPYRLCESGLECNGAGDCVVPPCGSDSDCTPGYLCEGGTCVPDADCPICGECTQNSDCGAQGICIPAGYIGETSVCSSWCNNPGDCPGNTECFQVPTQDGNIQLCFNGDAATRGPCPSDFVCQDGGDDTPGGRCAGVTCPPGEVCNPMTGACQGGGSTNECLVCETCAPGSTGECGASGSCLAFADGPSVCSVPCESDGSCPSNSTCFQLADTSGTTQNWCLNGNAASAGICASGWSCEDEVVDLCAGVSCGDGESCNPDTGQCEGGGGSDIDPPDGGGGDGDVRNADSDNDDDTPSCMGCSSTTGHRPSGVALLLSLLALIAVRRRR